jgi:hypothetical protein
MENAFVIYWIICVIITGYLLNKQSLKISLDGVIGNTPFFNVLVAVLTGGIFAPIYYIIKFIRRLFKRERFNG